MRTILLVLLVLHCVFPGSSQGFLKLTSGATLKSQNGAYLVLNRMSLENNGLIQYSQNEGTVKFTGNSGITISGSNIPTFARLELSLDPGLSLSLQNNIKVDAEFVFASGLLNLNNSKLDLGNLGLLINESEGSRAYSFASGYVESTAILQMPVSANPGNLGAVISSRKDMGLTIIRRGHLPHQNVSGTNPSILRYYDIEPTNNISLKATLQFFYFDGELNGLDENSLEQWKTKNNLSWDYVGADESNTQTNYVLRNNISKFSRWTLSGLPAMVNRPIAGKFPVQANNSSLVLSAFPNPTNYYFSISTGSNDITNPVYLKVTNVSGQLIELRNNILPGQTVRMGGNYTPGIYFIEARQGANRKLIKLVKQ